MARARNIKPGFYANEDLAECSIWARFIFPGLWMMADREGRLEYRPKKIKGELLRFDSQEAEPLLEELQRFGFILMYEVEGRKFIQILQFMKHQNPHHREAESEIPPPKSLGLHPLGNSSKPEAEDSSQDIEALGKPEASPGFETEDATCQGGQAGLIPDSGYLIPDSLIPEAAHREFDKPHAEEKSDALPEIQSTLTPEQKLALPIVKALRAEQVPIMAVNPLVAEWIAKGLTEAKVPELIAFIRTKGKVGSIHPNFINSLIDDALNPPKPKPKQDDWHRSDAGIARKAKELRVTAGAGWSYDRLKEKVWDEIRRKERQGEAA